MLDQNQSEVSKLNRIPKKRPIFLFLVLALLAGCAGLGINERPVVTLTNLRMLESEGLSMRFAIDLTITNPGPVSIPVNGLSWNLELEGSRILTGVSNEVPTPAPYTDSGSISLSR